ncbi:MAG: hypothetical protein Q4D65_03400 [Peptostreptococcaceae bacterium]|nr:hypothetical protein [Peptostreptococcaceae bacterium]
MKEYLVLVVLGILIFTGCKNKDENNSTSEIIVGNESVLINEDTKPIEVNDIEFTVFMKDDKQKEYENVEDIEKDLGYKFLKSELFYNDSYNAYYTNRESSNLESEIVFMKKDLEGGNGPFLSMYFLTKSPGKLGYEYDNTFKFIESKENAMGDSVAIIQTEIDNSYMIEFFHEDVLYSVSNIHASDLSEVYSVIDSFSR